MHLIKLGGMIEAQKTINKCREFVQDFGTLFFFRKNKKG